MAVAAMLEELSVRNYALIESLSISFNGGLTVLSGETGAGKSIIVGSLGFLLGAKADAQMIRLGAEEAQVSAVISIKETNTDALEWLKKHNIETEDGRIIVRRNIKTNGRTAIYIQNEPLNRSELADFMAFLFDIHGQHAHESLLRKETHRRYLDRFAGLEAEADEFNKIFLELAEKRKTLENSAANERDRGEKIEYLSFAVGEIEQAALKIGENKELESESKRLASYEKLAAHIEAASTALYEEDSVLSLARKAKAALDAASAIDSSLSAICQRVSSLFYEAEDLSSELREYCSLLSFDPQRLEAVEERLALLYKLKKKYASKNHSGETENMAT
ncbi:MAG: AAA family ATPase, partial [Spirochaetaceae bacterium]|nr:AAA family ATPase [Spirochaetaceae bacterium]